MLKTCIKLAEASSDIKLGNHRVEYTPSGRDFIYYWTVICSTNDSKRTFKTNDGGWGTSSTTRAINSYRAYFTGKGYKEIS